MGSISRNFSYSEFEKSDTASRLHINNAITSWEVRDNIKADDKSRRSKEGKDNG